MTPAAIAEFAQSDAGRLYAMTCARFGVDPAANIADDVLAHNLRVALAVSMTPDEPDAEEPAAAQAGTEPQPPRLHYTGGIH